MSRLSFALIICCFSVVGGMRSRLKLFSLPRGSLGNLREQILRQLDDSERVVRLSTYFGKRPIGPEVVRLWLGVAGDNLGSINTLIRYGVRCQKGLTSLML